MKVTDTVDPCPLCGISSAREVARTSYALIWRGLHDIWSAELSTDAVERHTPASDATLWRCERCALEYFSPLSPGDADFYEQLMRSVPYEGGRWEFNVAASTIDPTDAVADFGCGRGHFLERLTGCVRRAVGVDLNACAIRDLRAGGLEAYATDFEDFASRESGNFDAVCAFHLIEHLPRVRDAIVPALACLRPGGRLFISIPNRQRLIQDFEPLDFPPHHVSRWASPQLRFLAEEFHLDLVGITYEPPAYSAVSQLVAERAAAALLPLVGPGTAHILGRAYRRLRIGPARYARLVSGGAFVTRGLYGLTMLAEYRKRVGS